MEVLHHRKRTFNHQTSWADREEKVCSCSSWLVAWSLCSTRSYSQHRFRWWDASFEKGANSLLESRQSFFWNPQQICWFCRYFFFKTRYKILKEYENQWSCYWVSKWLITSIQPYLQPRFCRIRDIKGLYQK